MIDTTHLPGDRSLCCLECGFRPHRWMPSPDAGPSWRCSECGEPHPHVTIPPTEINIEDRSRLLDLQDGWDDPTDEGGE